MTTETTSDTREDMVLSCSPIQMTILEERLAKVAKAATRLGCEPPTIEILERLTETDPETHLPRQRIRYRVRGQAPVLPGGWRVVGRIDHLSAGNVVAMLPGFDADPYRDAKPTCDHCGRVRNRAKTLVVQDEAGKIMRMGVACLKDYVGHNVPVWADLTDPFTDEEMSSAQSKWEDITKAMTRAAWAITYFGFIPSSGPEEGSGTPTRWTMGSYGDRKHMDQMPVTREIGQLVEDAIAKFSQPDLTSNFDQNVRVLVASGVVDFRKHYGLIAAAVWSVLRDRAHAIEEASRPARVEIEPSPVPCGKQTVTGVVLSETVKETAYGKRAVMTVLDDRGFKVWGTNVAYADRGDRVTFQATLERGDRDETFGFFKRPTNMEILDPA